MLIVVTTRPFFFCLSHTGTLRFQVHGEMYAVQQKLDVMESKMLRPLMDQIDSAFQLHRGGSQQAKGGGGFVTVSKGGFVPIS